MTETHLGPGGTMHGVGGAAPYSSATSPELMPGQTIPARYLDQISQIDGSRYLLNGQLRSGSRSPSPVFSAIRDERGAKQQIGVIPDMTAEEALEALGCAQESWAKGRGEWARMSLPERIQRIELFVERILPKRELVATAIMLETGKRFDKAEAEFDRTIKDIRDSITYAREIAALAEKDQVIEGKNFRTSRAPKGIALCVGPFNYPFNETFNVVVPALLMGNAVIFKTPKVGMPASHAVLDELGKAVPPGAIHLLSGDGATVIGPLASSGKVNAVVFIGSAGVARIILDQFPDSSALRPQLGLGSKNPAIIMGDADLDLAVEKCFQGALSDSGVRCTATGNIFAHESIKDEFLERLRARIEKARCGMPWEPGVEITPLAEPGKVAHLQGVIADAEKHGAKVINSGGGEAQDNLMRPALLYPLNPDMRLWYEEQFGPLVGVTSFRDLAEVLAYQADNPHQQQVSIYSRDLEGAKAIAGQFENLGARTNINDLCQRGPDWLPFTGRGLSANGEFSIRDTMNYFSLPAVVTW